MPHPDEKGRLTEAAHWEQYWQEEHKGHPDSHIFDSIFRSLLPHGGDYYEIGCTPGKTLAYFSRNFGYRVCGIDYVGTELVHETMRRWGVQDYEVITADFLEHRFPDERQFDVVGSYGLIEHFADFESVVLRQAAYVKPGGYLIVEVPNLRGFNYALYSLFLPEEIKGSNLGAMRLEAITEPLRKHGFRIAYGRYFGTCFLHFDEQNAFLSSRPWLRTIVRACRRVLDAVGLGNVPSAFLSPYIVVVAQRSVV